MTKIKSLLLAVIGLLCSVSVSAYDFVADGIYYNIISNQELRVEVTHNGSEVKSYKGDVLEVPNSVDYNGQTYTVTKIGQFAFNQCEFKELVLPNTIEEIGYYSLSLCENLTSINIPASVKVIRSGAFSCCSNVKELVIPKTVEQIYYSGAEGPFEGMSGLDKLSVEDGNPNYDSRENCNAIIVSKTNTLIGACVNTIIPNSVTSISACPFYKNYRIQHINIPNSVTSIGSYAFAYSTLKSVTLGSGVTSIGDRAFSCVHLRTVFNNSSLNFTIGSSDYGCIAEHVSYVITQENQRDFEKLGSFWFYNAENTPQLILYTGSDSIVNLPKDYRGYDYSVDEEVFYGCSSLSSIAIPRSVLQIGDGAFELCVSLKNLVIEDCETSLSMGYYSKYDYQQNTMFKDCPLETLYLGRNLLYKGYGERAFTGIKTFKSLTFGDNVTTDIGEYEYSNCVELTDVVIGNTITNIRSGAFMDCTKLEHLVLGDGVESIGSSAFYDCKNLTRVTIPDNVSEVGDFAFSGCENITNLEIGSGVSILGTNTFRGCNRITDLSINCSIIDKWFAGKPLKKLLIGDSVTRIEDEAFYLCEDLTDIVMGNSVTRIGNQTFYGCSSLTNVDIPNSITEIGKNAFTNCSALTSISIPESVTNIGDGAFEGCRSLQCVILPNNWVKIVPNLFAYCSSLTSLTIPNSVTSIGADAFVNCKALTNLTIPNSVRSIGKSAFWGCSGLTNIVIPSKVTKIEEATFLGCRGLTNLDIPKNVKSIDVHAFEDCTGLTNITISNNVTSIGGCAFYGCANLNTITIGQNVTSLGDYVFAETAWYDNQPDGVVYLDKYLLDYKGTMPEQTSLNIKDGTVLIANLALGYTPNLISVTIPNSVTHIGKWAFNNCKDMKYLYISSEIESIEENAFYGCENLIDIQMASRKAIAVSEDIFSNSTYRKACLYVPNGCKADYEATTPWNKFNITEMDFTGVNDVFKDNTTSKVYYDLNGRMVTNPINGIYILNGKKVWVK